MQRRQIYSVAEICRMRAAVVRLHQGGFEDYLRTYMMNGTDPQELEDAATQAEAKRQETQRLIRERMLSEKPKSHIYGYWP